MIRWLFFDNDGILVDTEGIFYEACKRTLATIGVELTVARFREESFVRGTSMVGMARAAGLREDEVEALRIERDACYAELLRTAKPMFPDVPELLRGFAGRYRMGIVTSARRVHFEMIHATTGILPHFEFILAWGDYPRTKPAPDPYLAALERSGAQPDECLVIEDTPRGVASATAAGLRCAAVPHALTRGLDFPGACGILDSIRDLPGLIETFTRS